MHIPEEEEGSASGCDSDVEAVPGSPELGPGAPAPELTLDHDAAAQQRPPWHLEQQQQSPDKGGGGAGELRGVAFEPLSGSTERLPRSPLTGRRSLSRGSSGQQLNAHAHRPQWFSWRLFWAYTGPGWLMSVAYVDPGNIESDLQAGGYSGYQLLWVLCVSTLLGLFMQVLSVRLGVATGKNLAENCREYYGRGWSLVLYAMMQLAIIGSDIQEIVGSAIAFKVLFGWPLWQGCLVTGLDTLTFLGLHILGVRSLELIFVLLIAMMTVCFLFTFYTDPADPLKMLHGLAVPYVDEQATVQAVSILGAIVMPHSIYLHSGLVLSRDIDRSRAHKVAEANWYFSVEAALALSVSLLINCAIVAVFAHGFYSAQCQALHRPLLLEPSGVLVQPPFACVPHLALPGLPPQHHAQQDYGAQSSGVVCVTDSGRAGTCMPIGLQGAAGALDASLGPLARTVWAVGLLAAGQSSTMTGTYAGQFVMEGFLDLQIPNWVRVGLTRAVSLVPATIVAVLANSDYLAADRLDETLNVVQSMQLPFALLPLLCFTGSTRCMGAFANGQATRLVGWGCTGLVLAINAYLLMANLDLAEMGRAQRAAVIALLAAYAFVVTLLARDAWRASGGLKANGAEVAAPHAPHTYLPPAAAAAAAEHHALTGPALAQNAYGTVHTANPRAKTAEPRAKPALVSRVGSYGSLD